MKTLFILRHAKSSLGHPNLKDFDRPLNPHGQKMASNIGNFIKNKNILPELIICSTAQRARETMALLITSSDFKGAIIDEDNLYETSASDYIETIKEYCQNDNCIMIIGHNPACEELIYCLTDCHEDVPAATLAEISLNIASWQELKATNMQAKLQNIWQPKKFEQG